MTQIEKIQKIKRYITRTSSKFQQGTPYQMNLGELFTLAHMTAKDTVGAICLAFDYGRAKGYRAAEQATKKRAKARNTALVSGTTAVED